MASCSLVKAYLFETIGAGVAMFVSSVMLARLKEQSGPLQEGKVIEDKIK